MDDDLPVREKAIAEIYEETGIVSDDIVSIKEGDVFEIEEPKYNKTWIVHPVLADVKVDTISTDWEAQSYKWVTLDEISSFDLVPGFDRVIKSLF